MEDMERNTSEVTEGNGATNKLECAVCLQPCIQPVQLPCRHIFCYLCVKGVTQQNRRCALCRQEIPLNYLRNPQLITVQQPTVAFEGSYQWFYEGRNGWWQYDDRTSLEIEAAFKKGEQQCEVLIAGFLYTIDFQQNLQIRQCHPYSRRHIKRDLVSIPKKGVAGIRQNPEEVLQVSDDSDAVFSSGASACDLSVQFETTPVVITKKRKRGVCNSSNRSGRRGFALRRGRRYRGVSSKASGSLSVDSKCKTPTLGADKLIQNLEDLFLSGDHHDIIIKLKDQEIRAHKFILVVRSPVFDCMFRHDMIEKNTRVITIEDCDSEIFREFLFFLYSGRLKNVSAENVNELYIIADKYQVDGLKSACVEFMKRNMSDETFCDFISFALRHNETDLLNFATDYFVRNVKTIIETIKWRSFHKEYPDNSHELYIKAINLKQ